MNLFCKIHHKSADQDMGFEPAHIVTDKIQIERNCASQSHLALLISYAL